MSECSPTHAARRRRWRLGVSILAAALAAAVFVGYRVIGENPSERAIDEHMDAARSLIARARTANQEADALRHRMGRALYRRDKPAADDIWLAVRARAGDVRRLYAEADDPLLAALDVDDAHRPARALMAEILYQRALMAERDEPRGALKPVLQRLAMYDDDGRWRAKWNESAAMHIRTRPLGARVSLKRYIGRNDDTMALEPSGPHRTTPFDVQRPPGAYVLLFEREGMAPTHYPVRLARGERLMLDIELVPARAIPPGFVHVAAGRFMFGTNDETNRQAWNTTPRHARRTGAFAIARAQTTIEQWLRFSRTRPSAAAPKFVGGRLPTRAATARRDDGVGWAPATEEQRSHRRSGRANPGELRGSGTSAASISGVDTRERAPNGPQNAITGVSVADARAYMQWLDQHGEVPGARMCREDEWERAAGDADAPAPFGLLDMDDDIREMTVSIFEPDGIRVRGGASMSTPSQAGASYRGPWSNDARNATTGFRVCADILAIGSR